MTGDSVMEIKDKELFFMLTNSLMKGDTPVTQGPVTWRPVTPEPVT